MALDAVCLTDVGKVRQHNEDSCGCFPELGLWIVCDGMGGHDAGEVASAIAVESVVSAVTDGAELEQAVLKAHQDILEAPTSDRGRPGMGTTIVALQVQGPEYSICWVGDSRAYLWDGKLQRLTRDHSYVQSLQDAGVLSEAEARHHPQRNVITQALGAGVKADMNVGRVTGRFNESDRILLCSDGLTGELEDHGIATRLGDGYPLAVTAERLMRDALNLGGRDNVTVLLVEYGASEEACQRADTRPNPVVN